MKYQINTERILFTEFGDDGVIYDTENNEYFTANATFYRIFKGILNEKTIEEIVEALTNEFRISHEECAKKVESVIEILKVKNYIF